MSLKKFFIERTIVFVMVAVALGISHIWKVNAPGIEAPVSNTEQKDITSYRASLTGTYTSCLPRHDNFSKEECVVGIEVERGVYYALDFSLLSQTKPELKDGDTFTASGLVTPMEMISSDTTRHIIGKGIFSVTDIGSSRSVKNATFEWLYSPFEKNDMPWVKISLSAKYDDGTSETKLIDTIEGSCVDYDKRDADVYPASTMIMCYYAGFGRYYKVVKKESGYEVQRKEFEEASPEYSPPVQDFQTIIKL